MAAGHVHIERDDAIAILRLDRPPANAIDLEFAGEIEARFAELAATPDMAALVITGAGACFSAGLDLKRVPTYDARRQREMVSAVNRMILRLYSFDRPVVAAVNGHAIAGGLIFALACDYRVGTRAPCKLGVTEVRAGIPFPAAAMAVLQAELPASSGRVLTLGGRNVDSATALSLGVLDELQAAERVLPAAIEVARDLAASPADAYARIKRQLRGATIDRLEGVIAGGTDPMLELWLSSGAAAASSKLLRGET